MNNDRRKMLREVIKKFDDLVNDIDEIIDELQEIKDEEECAFENMPENLQDNSERGQQMQANIDCLDDAIAELNDVLGIDLSECLY